MTDIVETWREKEKREYLDSQYHFNTGKKRDEAIKELVRSGVPLSSARKKVLKQAKQYVEEDRAQRLAHAEQQAQVTKLMQEQRARIQRAN